MVVLLILAILLAIAIPTFLTVGISANDRAAQSNLNTAIVAAKGEFQANNQEYQTDPGLQVSSLNADEPSLSYQAGGTPLGLTDAQNTISVATAVDGGGIVMAVLTKTTGDCWYIVDNGKDESSSGSAPWSSAGSTPTGSGTYYGEWQNVSGPGDDTVICDADVAPSGSNYSFSSGGFPSL